MSGASGSFPAIIHLHPEAAKGGNIGKIKDDDSLTINLETGNLDIDLSEDEFNLRSVELNPISQEGVGRELFSIFRNSVTDVDDGASVFD
jgi:phosphogluconate dehydratase